MKRKLIAGLFAVVCVSAGLAVFAACGGSKVKNNVSEKTEDSNWDTSNIVWNWNEDDPYKVTATVKDKTDPTKILSLHPESDIKLIYETEATCEQDGISRYSATVTIDGISFYSDTHDYIVPARGHDYYVNYFDWDTSTDDYTCQVRLYCVNEGQSVTKEATVTSEVTTASTCTKKGTKTFTASIEGFDNTDNRTLALPLVEHNYSNNYCTVCNEHSPTEGLVYGLNQYSNTYYVESLGGSTDKDIYIPSSYNGIEVTKIYYEVFNVNTIETITIPSSVTTIYSDIEYVNRYKTYSDDISTLKKIYYLGTIEEWSDIYFYVNPMHNADLYIGGKLVTEANISSGTYYSSWGRYAFADSKITSATLGDGVTQIGEGMFLNCTDLKTVTIPEGVKTIDRYAFYGCTSLEEIVIPSTVTKIANEAFEGCTSLKKVTILSSEISYGGEYDGYTFYGCSSLKEVVLSNELTALAAYMFRNCISLETVQLPTGITKIPAGLFYGCTSLKNITIPSTVTSIGAYAFEDCDLLKSVTIPTGVTSIGTGAFSGCNGLSSITIPSTVTSIENEAFRYCGGIKEVYNYSNLQITAGDSSNGGVAQYAVAVYKSASATSSIVTTTDGFMFITSGTDYYLVGYSGTETELTLPESYNDSSYKIKAYAFYNRADIASVTIPKDAVTEIGERAFYKCARLWNIDLGNVSTIGREAFYGCNNLTSIIVPASVTSLDENAFRGCEKLLEVYNLSSQRVYTSTTLVKTHSKISEDSIFDKQGDFIFYTDSDSNSYLVAYVGDSKDVELPSYTRNLYSVNYDIYKYAFADNTFIESVVIGYSVKGIGVSAFSGCKNLKNITIETSEDRFGEVHGNVESIARYAFSNTAYYNNGSNWKDGVLYIGNYLIEASSAVGNCTVKDNTLLIANYAFYDNTKLLNVTLPSTVIYVGEEAFNSCYSLKSVVQTDGGLYKVGEYAFSRCYSLTKISTAYIECIGKGAFSSCYRLMSFTISEGCMEIGEYAFNDCLNLVEVYNLSDTITVEKGASTNGGVAKYALAVHTSKSDKSNIKTEGNYTYYDGANKAYLLSYNGSGKNVTLPEKLNDKVYDIYSYAFYASSIKSITIPEGVTSIGTCAFSNCSSLKSVVIHDGVTNIGESAFANCSYLESIVIPDSVTSIGYNAFYYCSRLSSITLSSNLTSIQAGLFDYTAYYKDTSNWENDALYMGNYLIAFDNKNATSYKVKEGTVVIADGVFSNSYSECNITSIVIPSSVKNLGNSTFWSSKITSIDLSNTGITSIGDSVFYCSSLTTIVLPSNLQSIGNYAFYGCEIESIDLSGTSVTTIGEYAFNGSSVKTVVLPASVTSIGYNAFNGCSIESFTINSNATLADSAIQLNYDSGKIILGENATEIDFSKVYGLTEIEVAESNTNYTSIGGILYNKEVTEIVYVPRYLTGSVTIPDTVTAIADEQFSGRKISGIVIGSGVKTIGAKAFEYCSNLTDVTIGSGVVSIGEKAFFYSKYYNTDSNWKSGALWIGKWLVDIKTGYQTLTYDSKVADKVLDGFVYTVGGVYYRGDAVEYVSSNVKESITSIVIFPYATTIPDSAFKDCVNLNSLYIPSSVTKIGKEILYGVNWVKIYFGAETLNFGSDGISLNYNVIASEPNSSGGTTYTSIAQDYIYKGVSYDSVSGLLYQIGTNSNDDTKYAIVCGYVGSATDVVIPAKLGGLDVKEMVYIGAFENNKQVTSVTINAAITTIPKEAFKDCTALESFTACNITTIGLHAFDGCTALKTVTLNVDKTTATDYSISIAQDAFGGCTALESIKIPFIPIFAPYAFRGCTNLTSVEVENPLTGTQADYWSGTDWYVYEYGSSDGQMNLVVHLTDVSAENLATYLTSSTYGNKYLITFAIVNAS
jgi:hypothetical protein